MKERVMCVDCIHGDRDQLKTPLEFNGKKINVDSWMWCNNFDVVVDEDDFCSMGIEKDGTESNTLTEKYFSESVGKMDLLFDIYGVREDG